MFFCPPGIHIDANLGNQAEGCRFTNAIDLSQIHAADSKRFFSDVEFHLISSLLVDPTGGFEAATWLRLGLRAADMLRNLLIAFDDLLLVVVKRLPKVASTQTGAPFGNHLQEPSRLLPRSREFVRASCPPTSCDSAPHRQSPE